jgi:hypothetical protein
MVLIAMIAMACASTHARGDDDKKPAASQPSEPVPYAKLKEALPTELIGLKRTSATGQKISAGAVKMTQAEGKYGTKDGDKPPTLNVQIVDYSATPDMAAGMAAWSKLEIDQDSDTGYQKTLKINGNPAFEEYKKDSKNGQLQIFVAGKFIVSVTASNVADDQFQKIGEGLSLDKLAALAK